MQAQAEIPRSQMAVAPRRVRLGGAVGWLLVGLALLALGYEIQLAAHSGSYRLIPSGELWYRLNAASLNLVQAVIQRHVHPLLWQPVLSSVLQWPAWSLLGAPGVALVLACSGQRGDR